MLTLSKQLKDQLLRSYVPRLSFEEQLFMDDDADLTLDLLRMQGLDITLGKEGYEIRTLNQKIKSTLFCIVDIETNGSKISKDQVIEIGAVKIQNGKTIDTFDSLIYADTLPDTIAELTGITLNELMQAPSLKSVMHSFRLFLGDAVFVAHALKFDYNFISEMFERSGLGPMLNPGLCTIDLAERTFSSAKYGLSYLNKSMELDESFQQHRALNDALITQKVFQYSLKKLPRNVKLTKELIRFSKEAKRMPRAPLIEFED